MNSRVLFEDETIGERREVTIVFPQQSDASGRVSVLAPVGTALLGLAAGQSIVSPFPDGKPHSLRGSELSISQRPGQRPRTALSGPRRAIEDEQPSAFRHARRQASSSALGTVASPPPSSYDGSVCKWTGMAQWRFQRPVARRRDRGDIAGGHMKESEMMNLVGMGIFARVAEAKGFSAAARRLGISKSVVSKEVAKLEKSLGARLLNRTTRQLSLTEVGAAFYDHCARIVQEAEEAALLVDRLHAKPRGASSARRRLLSRRCTSPLCLDFLARNPEVQVDMTVGDRFFDLADEGFDLAIRIARDLPPNMVARKLAPINRVVCATPGYFEKYGVPVVPQDLAEHNCLVYTHANPDSSWRFTSPEGDIAVQVRGNLRLNDDEVIWRSVLGGLGISILPTFTVGKDLQSGRLQAVLTEYVPTERNLYALYLPNRHLSAKVRVFIDFLLECFDPPPYWDRGWSTLNANPPGRTKKLVNARTRRRSRPAPEAEARSTRRKTAEKTRGAYCLQATDAFLERDTR